MLFKLRVLFYYFRTKYFRRFRNRASLLHFQERQVRRHLKWVVKKSPFYKAWFGDLPLHRYRELPFLEKSIMMENFSDLNTRGIDRDEAIALALSAETSRDFKSTLNGVTVGLSSGTSGNRGIFLVSDQERALHAGTILAKLLPGSIFSRYKVAFFMRANSNLYTASQSSRIEFQFFDLLMPLQDHFGRLKTWVPDLVFAPPSLLIRLAEAQKSGVISIWPKRIFSIAETLDPLDEMKIQETFHQKIHQVYQCTEGFLGISCNEGTIHLNEDCTQIEPFWLDADHIKFMPVITDFSRTSQPLIRYRLNDILTRKLDPCPCGSALMAIESIEGRADDIIFFPEGISVFPDFIRRAIIQAHPKIEEYLVRQLKHGELVISVRCENIYRSEIETRIREEIEILAQTVKSTPPHLQFARTFPELQGKKLRRVIQEDKR